MKIIIRGSGEAAVIEEIELSKNEHYWVYYIYTKELGPFGTASQQGNYRFWVTYKAPSGTCKPGTLRELDWTILEFVPEDDEDREHLQSSKILLDTAKSYCPERTKGQYCQKLFLIKPTEDERAVQAPLFKEISD